MGRGNFRFLAELFPELEKMGSLAEAYLYTDASACLNNMGSLAETIVIHILEIDGLTPPSGSDNTHANRIRALEENDLLSKDIADILHVLRIMCDEALFEGYDSFEECKALIEMTYTLSTWFMQIYGDFGYEPVPFVMPGETTHAGPDEEQIDEGQTGIGPGAAPAPTPAPAPAPAPTLATQRRKRAEKANESVKLSEKDTRSIIDMLLESDANKTKTEQARAKMNFRRFQLVAMGFVSIFIGPLVLFTTSVTYGLCFPNSISETATISNRAGAILPFCLGALALFALTYAIVYAYDKMDKIFTIGMASGFTLVAMQMCASRYIKVPRVGLFGVTPEVSHILHMVGAIAGFGAMIFWVMLCFRKSDKSKELQTKRKLIRNQIYFYSGIAMILSLGLFVIDLTGAFGERFPVVFVAECAMLLFGGVSCLIKGGLFLCDK